MQLSDVPVAQQLATKLDSINQALSLLAASGTIVAMTIAAAGAQNGTNLMTVPTPVPLGSQLYTTLNTFLNSQKATVTSQLQALGVTVP